MTKQNTIPLAIRKQRFVVDYITQHGPVNITDSDFVDAYIEEFKPTNVRGSNYGAHKCPAIAPLLKKLYDCNILERYRVSLWAGCNLVDGFPAWVYVYELKKY